MLVKVTIRFGISAANLIACCRYITFQTAASQSRSRNAAPGTSSTASIGCSGRFRKTRNRRPVHHAHGQSRGHEHESAEQKKSINKASRALFEVTDHQRTDKPSKIPYPVDEPCD